MAGDGIERPGVDSGQSAARRDLTYFLLGPGLLALGAAALFHLSPWPTPLRAQPRVSTGP